MAVVRLIAIVSRFTAVYRPLISDLTRATMRFVAERFWQSSYCSDVVGSNSIIIISYLLARPLNLAAMSDLGSGVLSQTQEVMHLPGVY